MPKMRYEQLQPLQATQFGIVFASNPIIGSSKVADMTDSKGNW